MAPAKTGGDSSLSLVRGPALSALEVVLVQVFKTSASHSPRVAVPATCRPGDRPGRPAFGFPPPLWCMCC